MKAAAILSLLALTGAQGWSTDMPPREFRKPVQASVFILPSRDVHEVCAPAVGATPDVIVFACSNSNGKGTGVMVLPDPCPLGDAGEFYARIVCHEMGHLNGWRHG